jgi:hypothetical protein
LQFIGEFNNNELPHVTYNINGGDISTYDWENNIGILLSHAEEYIQFYSNGNSFSKSQDKYIKFVIDSENGEK